MRLTSILRWSDYHNLPRKFIDRFKFNGIVVDSNYRICGPKAINFIKHYRYGRHAPWTAEAIADNDPKKKRPLVVATPVKDWFYFRGDKVEVLTGRDKGKQGTVCGIVRERNWVFVENLNAEFKARDRIVGLPLSFHWELQPLCALKSVRLVDPYDLKQCNVQWRYTGDGVRVRVSTRTGRIIPIPEQAYETIDYAKKSVYKPGDRDTPPDEVKKPTVSPLDCTFYESMMIHHQIRDNRCRGPVYTY
ncbi:hypothetical protein ACOME3_001916 [Neoechinorhynchus agilis]